MSLTPCRPSSGWPASPSAPPLPRGTDTNLFPLTSSNTFNAVRARNLYKAQVTLLTIYFFLQIVFFFGPSRVVFMILSAKCFKTLWDWAFCLLLWPSQPVSPFCGLFLHSREALRGRPLASCGRGRRVHHSRWRLWSLHQIFCLRLQS